MGEGPVGNHQGTGGQNHQWAKGMGHWHRRPVGKRTVGPSTSGQAESPEGRRDGGHCRRASAWAPAGQRTGGLTWRYRWANAPAGRTWGRPYRVTAVPSETVEITESIGTGGRRAEGGRRHRWGPSRVTAVPSNPVKVTEGRGVDLSRARGPTLPRGFAK